MLAALLLIAVMGCSAHRDLHVREDDLIGTWVGADGATLGLYRDHSLVGMKMPFQLASPAIFSSAWSGSGTWRLASASKYEDVHVDAVLNGSVDAPIDIGRLGRGFGLFLWVGDPDEGKRYWLRRQ